LKNSNKSLTIQAFKFESSILICLFLSELWFLIAVYKLKLKCDDENKIAVEKKKNKIKFVEIIFEKASFFFLSFA
jgi:hypothetical protein